MELFFKKHRTVIKARMLLNSLKASKVQQQLKLSVSCLLFSCNKQAGFLPLVSLGSRLRRKEIAPQPDPSTTTRVRGSPVAVYVFASCHGNRHV